MKADLPTKKGPRVGFFDSGIGGFSILAEVMRRRPELDALYVADEAGAPYGTKSPEFVLERARDLSRLLWEQGCDIVVVACNTATAVAVDRLRQEFKGPFVGVEPYINYINKEKDRVTQGGVGVLTTVLMSKSQRFNDLKKRLDPDNKVKAFASEHLAPLVEEAFLAKGVSEDLRRRIHDEIRPLAKENLGTLILGCTHYPLAQKYLEEVLGPICVSPAGAVADRLISLLPPAAPGALPQGGYYFLSTSKKQWSWRTPEQTPLWPTSK